MAFRFFINEISNFIIFRRKFSIRSCANKPFAADRKKQRPLKSTLGSGILMKNKKFYTYLVVIIFVLFLSIIPQSFAVQSQINADDRPEKIFYGRWRTDSGSLYEYVNGAMICISVHDNRYKGWINKVAIKNFRLKNDGWYVDQAIRIHTTGRLTKWMIAKIEIIDENSFNKTIICSEKGRPNLYGPQIWEKLR